MSKIFTFFEYLKILQCFYIGNIYITDTLIIEYLEEIFALAIFE